VHSPNGRLSHSGRRKRNGLNWLAILCTVAVGFLHRGSGPEFPRFLDIAQKIGVIERKTLSGDDRIFSPSKYARYASGPKMLQLRFSPKVFVASLRRHLHFSG
jgi:hypothetical protein